MFHINKRFCLYGAIFRIPGLYLPGKLEGDINEPDMFRMYLDDDILDKMVVATKLYTEGK